MRATELRVEIAPAATLKGMATLPTSRHAKALSHDEVIRFPNGVESCDSYRATVIALR